MNIWAIVHENGHFEQIFSEEEPKIEKGKVYPLDRMGDLMNEQFVPGKGWELRPLLERQKHSDAGYDLDHPFQRLLDYAVKEIEARIILGTLASEGRLAQEAALRNSTVEALASDVVSRASEQRAPELERIAAKLANADRKKGV